MSVAVTAPRAGRRKKGSLLRQERIDGVLMASPWILGFLLWTAGPMIASIALAFMDYPIMAAPTWVGLGNYQKAFSDRLFWLSLYNTAYYTGIAVPSHVIVALTMALILNMNVRGIRTYRTIYYIPSVTPAVASAILWRWIFNPEFGLLNALMDLLHLPRQLWLYDPALAKPCFIIMTLWGLGSTIIIFLAGLQNIPPVLYEAARIDGAGSASLMRFVTLPLLTPVIFFNIIMQIIGSFQIFTAAYIMTGGGPQNATLFYVLYLFRNGFEYFKMGYASSLAWILFVIILFFTLIQFTLANRWVYYEGDIRPTR